MIHIKKSTDGKFVVTVKALGNHEPLSHTETLGDKRTAMENINAQLNAWKAFEQDPVNNLIDETGE